jgi:hypothetical protein
MPPTLFFRNLLAENPGTPPGIRLFPQGVAYFSTGQWWYAGVKYGGPAMAVPIAQQDIQSLKSRSFGDEEFGDRWGRGGVDPLRRCVRIVHSSEDLEKRSLSIAAKANSPLNLSVILFSQSASSAVCRRNRYLRARTATCSPRSIVQLQHIVCKNLSPTHCLSVHETLRNGTRVLSEFPVWENVSQSHPRDPLQAGSLLNRADLAPYFEVNFLSVPRPRAACQLCAQNPMEAFVVRGP